MPRTDFSEIPIHERLPNSPIGEDGEAATIVIVGGGPVGLTAAIDLGQRGHHVVLLSQFDFISAGSKAICFAKRTLDIWNRLGVVQPIIEKGVIWNVGKVFRGDKPDPIFQFDMLPIKNQEMPGFVNIQQYWVEKYLIEAAERLETVDVRWGHQVSSIDTDNNILTVQTDDGQYTINADWVLACDGSKSPVRKMMGLDFHGRVFEDNFLIADVVFQEQRPSERWFWFDPPWGGASALLHKQPDSVWRLDFQLGQDIDRAEAIRPENVAPFVSGMIGDNVAFEEEWYSVYTFQCRRMERFVHGRVIFLGDSAHLVSPFGARGCNGGIADTDNLTWKLDAVIKGQSSDDLIETYNDEAITTADENILNSSRSTDFMTPKSDASRALRDAVLDLATDYEFARPFVNSGRLSTPVSYPRSSLTTPDADEWNGGVPPGSPALDGPLKEGWLLNHLGGEWTLLSVVEISGSPLPTVIIDVPYTREQYALDTEQSVYFIRPDQYVAARWKNFQLSDLEGTAWATL